MKHTIQVLAMAFLLIAVSAPIWSSGEQEVARVADDEITVSLMLSEHALSPVNQDAPAYREIYRKTGVKLDIEPVPSSDYSAKANVMMATGQIPDIVAVRMNHLNDFASSGVFLALSQPIRESAPNLQRMLDSVSPEYKRVLIDGELYHIPTVFVDKKRNGRVPYIRKDILDQLGVAFPETLDELFDVLKAMKARYPESQPWTNRNKTANLLRCTAYPLGSGYGIYFDKDVDGGKWVYGTVQPEMKDVLAYHRRSYEAGVLDPDFAVQPTDKFHEKLGSGKSFFVYENMSFLVNYNASLESTDPDARFARVPIMENAKGQRRTFFYNNQHLNYGYSINSASKHIDRILQLFDWMVSEEGYAVTNYGIEGEHYTVEQGRHVIKPEVLADARTKSDPFRGMQADLGTGLLQFCSLVDYKIPDVFDPPEVVAFYEDLKADPGMVEPVKDPPFTEEERERLKKLKTDVDNVLAPALDGFIVGTISLDDFQATAAKARKAGADEIAAIYNMAEDRIK
jgi:putative aldouronate transport system substrate-binding protein